MLDNKKILVTGGSGSFGQKFCEMTLAKYKPKKIIVLSRSEHMQEDMQRKLNDDTLDFFIGDVRDLPRLQRAFSGVDIVIHAAALKVVPKAEYDPQEYVKTNVNGTMNVIEACLDNKVEKAVFLSTDKAVSPINLYGASKMCAEKLWIAANSYSKDYPRPDIIEGKAVTITFKQPQFSAVRYGNVMGSRGSVVPLFVKLKKEGKGFPITDWNMTRFMITLERAVELVWSVLETAQGGEIFVPKIPAMNIEDIAEACGMLTYKEIGIRPGEKMHEQLITEHEKVIMHGKYYTISNKGETGINYNSNDATNSMGMSIERLQEWIRREYGES